jgi:hypothetical protein
MIVPFIFMQLVKEFVAFVEQEGIFTVLTEVRH